MDVLMMPDHKIIEVSVKNKKHLACCGTINSLLSHMEKTQQEMKELQKDLAGIKEVPPSKSASLTKKIDDMNKRYNDLKEKSEICGCTDN